MLAQDQDDDWVNDPLFDAAVFKSEDVPTDLAARHDDYTQSRHCDLHRHKRLSSYLKLSLMSSAMVTIVDANRDWERGESHGHFG